MNLQEKVLEIVNLSLLDDSLFVVEVNVKETGLSKVEILIDGDNGVDIDTCAAISRSVGDVIETENLITGTYHLEVSSPGVGQPLRLLRQYEGNIGRQLKVILLDGKEINGKLKAINGNQVLLEVERRKKKHIKKLEEVLVAITEIKQAKVQVSFK
ncbi:MAG: ribosome maturation factor RimP [Bacteroidota bacterium]